jgi:aryl-alcohol dehydrogenase-like predicted oxidoreductase
MEYATLSHTDLRVSKLCFGTMTSGDGSGLFKAISAVDQPGGNELVKTSLNGGMNFFDTADNCTHSAIMSSAHRKKPHPGHSRRRSNAD